MPPVAVPLILGPQIIPSGFLGMAELKQETKMIENKIVYFIEEIS